MAKEEFIILSIKHTSKEDDAISMWRPRDHGYTYHVDAAGVYTHLKKGYHDTETNVPVKRRLVMSLSKHNGFLELVLANNISTWTALGVDINRTPFKNKK